MMQVGEHPACIVITYGSDVDKVIAKAEANGISLIVVNARFFKPLDETMLEKLASLHLDIIVYETDILAGGLSSAILEFYNDQNIVCMIKRIGIHDHFVEQGSLPQLRKVEHIDIPRLFEWVVSKI